MQYTLRNYTKKTFTRQELLDLQAKGVRFCDPCSASFSDWNFDAQADYYAVSERFMDLFLSLVEGAKKEAAEDSNVQFPAFVPLTEMQLKVVDRFWDDWCNYCGSSTLKDYFAESQERIHNEIIEEMKQEAAKKKAEEARRKAEEEEKDYAIVDVNATFEYDQRKFAFVQVACGKYKIFQVQDGKIGWNRYFDEEFLLQQKVKISSLFKDQ